jgi:hypothetical protein
MLPVPSTSGVLYIHTENTRLRVFADGGAGVGACITITQVNYYRHIAMSLSLGHLGHDRYTVHSLRPSDPPTLASL